MEVLDRHDTSLHEEGRFRLLVDAITDYAIYMLSPEGIVTSWNTGAQRFKGYKPSEILGEHFSRFYVEEDRAAGIPERALATALEQGRFEGRAGASARTAAASGRMSSSIRSAAPPASLSALPRSPAI